MKLTTLIIIHQHPKVLLGMKKRGFGEGRWNGFGGKVEGEESIEEAAIREIEEEIGIKPRKIKKHGILQFEFKDNSEGIKMHIFRGEDFDGEAKEGEEMKPEWFHVDKIPFRSMWSDDPHWMPHFLEKKKFKGRFLFDNSDDNNILEKELEIVEKI
tara:strand:- start:1273 stop:1740 length:468 start_codon:yes stop_codon:yes gene_type:complete